MVKVGPGTSNGSRVGQHAERARDLGQVAAGNERGRLVADAELSKSSPVVSHALALATFFAVFSRARTHLETGRAPVDELNRALGLDGRDGSVDILGDDVSAVQQRASHVLARARVALDHLIVGLEARHGQLGDRVGLVRGFAGRDDRGVGREREVNARERDQVGLELVQVDVQRAGETERGRDRRYDLSNDAVQVLEAGRLNAELGTADVVDRLVVNEERAVDVLESGVGREDGVVGLDDGVALRVRAISDLFIATSWLAHHLGRGVDSC